MNVFPTSLASMIDDLRACTHKQLPELFPLMASLQPRALRLKDGLSSSGGRTASWSRRGTPSYASCPCPSSTSAAPRRGRCPRCGSSTATTACWLEKRRALRTTSCRQHRQRHGVGDLPRVPQLLPPHRRPGPGGRDGELPGLLPGAVRARPHPLRHAARGRLGRHAAALGPQHSHSPHHRRAGLQGRAPRPSTL